MSQTVVSLSLSASLSTHQKKKEGKEVKVVVGKEQNIVFEQTKTAIEAERGRWLVGWSVWLTNEHLLFTPGSFWLPITHHDVPAALFFLFFHIRLLNFLL